jgi:hypothetical protein
VIFFGLSCRWAIVGATDERNQRFQDAMGCALSEDRFSVASRAGNLGDKLPVPNEL